MRSQKFGGDDKAKEFSASSIRTFRCSTTARAARPSLSFERGTGDVLLAWENEAFLAQKEFGKDKFEIVAPPRSILAEPPVSVVDRVADKSGTREVADAYLKFWYTPEGQEIAARNFYRPRDAGIAKKYRGVVREDRAFHHRRCVRRLDQSAERPFRGRRHFRPDLQQELTA